MAKWLVRNAAGRPLPCVWADCWQAGDNRNRVQIPHPQPRWDGEKLVYIFCSELHLQWWVAEQRKAHGNAIALRRING